MREIKFRAKRIDIDRWIYGQYFTTPLTDENSGTTPDAGWFFLTGETRHCIVQNCVAFVIDLNTLGQYTSLKDKNGKEIYNGDILNWRNFNDVEFVGVVAERPGVTYIDWKKPSEYPSYIFEAGTSKMEVIGNIYENPELLEEAK